jgi:L-rhamnose isomerase
MVLVDTGHHYQGQNIEQIVAWPFTKMMGGLFQRSASTPTTI